MIGALDIIEIFIKDVIPEGDWWQFHKIINGARIKIEDESRASGSLYKLPNLIDIGVENGIVGVYTIDIKTLPNDGKQDYYGSPIKLGKLELSSPNFESEFKKIISDTVQSMRSE